jgi:hypothetical protein
MTVTIVLDPPAQVSNELDEVSLNTCPVCDELPERCTCLRPSVRRKIARELQRKAADINDKGTVGGCIGRAA